MEEERLLEEDGLLQEEELLAEEGSLEEGGLLEEEGLLEGEGLLEEGGLLEEEELMEEEGLLGEERLLKEEGLLGEEGSSENVELSEKEILLLLVKVELLSKLLLEEIWGREYEFMKQSKPKISFARRFKMKTERWRTETM